MSLRICDQCNCDSACQKNLETCPYLPVPPKRTWSWDVALDTYLMDPLEDTVQQGVT